MSERGRERERERKTEIEINKEGRCKRERERGREGEERRQINCYPQLSRVTLWLTFTPGGLQYCSIQSLK